MQLDNSILIESLTHLEERYKKLYEIGEQRLNNFQSEKNSLLEKINNYLNNIAAEPLERVINYAKNKK